MVLLVESLELSVLLGLSVEGGKKKRGREERDGELNIFFSISPCHQHLGREGEKKDSPALGSDVDNDDSLAFELRGAKHMARGQRRARREGRSKVKPREGRKSRPTWSKDSVFPDLRAACFNQIQSQFEEKSREGGAGTYREGVEARHV